MAALAKRYRLAIKPEQVQQLADRLGVSTESLIRLHVGWDGKAWTFPMVDIKGHVIGIRRRFPDGTKLSVTGGHNGIFIPTDLPDNGTLLITEGESDEVAALDLGFPTIGRPGCKSCVDLIKAYTKGRDVVVVADNDKSGQDGANKLALKLAESCSSVKVIHPPDGIKDARKWKASGATREDVLRAIQAATSAVAEKKQILRWRPFPLELLPETLRAFVVETAKSMDVDVVCVAQHVLSVVSAAIGTTRSIELKLSWPEFPVIWTATVQRSGTLKTPALKAAVAAIQRQQSNAFREYDKAMEDYSTELLQYEEELKKWKIIKKNKAAVVREPPTKPKPPILKRYVVTDTTIEAVGAILNQNPRGVLLTRDELSGWFSGFSQYKGGKGSDEESWMELYSAGPLTIDRKSLARPIRVEKAAVSITGTIQPGVLSMHLTSQRFESGLVARFLFVMPPTRPSLWTDSVPSWSVKTAYEDMVGDLLALDFIEGKYGPEPIGLGLEPGALGLWRPWHNDIAKRATDPETPEAEAASLQKCQGLAARFALIFTLAENPAAETVSVESIRRGIMLADWYAAEQARVYQILCGPPGQARDSQNVELIRRKGGSVSVRAWQRIKTHKTANDAEMELDGLVKSGYGRWEIAPQRPQGGRPTKQFILTPDSSDTDKTPCGDTVSGGCVSVSSVRDTEQQNLDEPADSLGQPGDDVPQAAIGEMPPLDLEEPDGPGVGGLGSDDDPAIPDGWTRASWIDHQRRLADRCQSVRPDLAAKHRAEADRLESGGHNAA